MAVVRRNITTTNSARDQYVAGMQLLKQESSGLTPSDLGISLSGPDGNQPISTWDTFVIWHVAAMNQETPIGSDRNAAHRGPVFLPWHRWMLILLERHLQRVLSDQNFGLPYWDWAADGEVPSNQQPSRAVWSASCMGGNGRPSDQAVTTGPFRTGAFAVRIETNSSGSLRATNRPLRRSFRQNTIALPRKADVGVALGETAYDRAPWDGTSTGFRNDLEGWLPAGGLHNGVHVWIGGDMLRASSPNDPVFFLNHCNVDRIWAAWQSRNPLKRYLPAPSAPQYLFRHRRNDPLYDILTQVVQRPADVLKVSNVYTYDNLTVEA